MLKRILTDEIKNSVYELRDSSENKTTEIAIIGMSVQMPLADSLDEFWDNICNRVDCVRPLPEIRKTDMDLYKSYSYKECRETSYIEAGYLEEIDKFDYEFFRLTPKEAKLMDPHLRLFLQKAWHAIEDAGYGNNKLKGTKTGVYVGHINSGALLNYHQMIKELEPDSFSLAMTGNLAAMIPSRVSYLLDLKGPSITIDTTCSSSLVAIHTACQAILLGDCDQALVGSVKIIMDPERQDSIGIESSSGRAKAFDDSSDGTGVGEGAAVIFMKPFRQAQADGDHIYAVIKGSAVNQDGTSIGITAPSAAAQANVIAESWAKANIDPKTISYIEAHGTGTKLGDPIEVAGIQQAFQRFTNRKQFCGLGTVKSNIGHLDQAAGITGLIKAVLSLKKRMIAPTLHFNIPNREISFETSPVYINDRLKQWDTVDDEPRRCGVSAFGLSGTNCHIVLEEYCAPRIGLNEEEAQRWNVFTLSAKNEESLVTLLQKYEQLKYGDLRDLCYTVNTGRGHYNFRLAIVFKTLTELTAVIRQILAEGLAANCGDKWHYGISGENMGNHGHLKFLNGEAGKKLAEFLENQQTESTSLQELCKYYIGGADVEWERLYINENRTKVSLPAYPFNRLRCWVDVPAHGQTNREITLDGRASQEEYTETEKRLAEIWGSMLDYQHLNVYESFFSLGGDSIFAARLIHQLNERMKLKLLVSDLFRCETIYELAAFIDRGQNNPSSITATIPAAAAREYYPMSSAQQRIFILQRFSGNSIAYNIPNVMKIKGQLGFAQLESLCQKLVQRHESFRTSFHFVNGKAVQKIHAEVNLQPAYILERHQPITRILNDFVQPFDLSEAPLIRIAMVESKDGTFLMFDTHHIITDGVSLNLWLRDMIDLLDQRPLNDLTIHYKDYAVWEADFSQSREYMRQEHYWLKALSGPHAAISLPLDFDRPDKQSFSGSRYSLLLEQEVAERLSIIAKEQNVTMFMLLLAGYYILLAPYSLNKDIIVGTPVANRITSEAQNIVGMFVNTLPLRSYPEAETSFTEYLNVLKPHVLEAFKNQNYPFEMMVEKLNISRDPSRNPIFDTLFVFQNMLSDKFAAQDCEFEFMQFDSNKSLVDLTLEVVPFKDKLVVNFEYCTDLFKVETIRRLAGQYVNILEQISLNAHIQIKSLQADAGQNQLSGEELFQDIRFNF
ncbi:condensation domain-containing protein [Paenibacillus sp. FSL R7-0345]|uniref:condensation domain-containing protein n=1 Tax=Paenibacillus sp. FSL R7-0345 TaxID=2954535 RepID=UPI00315A0677